MLSENQQIQRLRLVYLMRRFLCVLLTAGVSSLVFSSCSSKTTYPDKGKAFTINKLDETGFVVPVYKDDTFTPSTSREKYDYLRKKCDENMEKRYAGYMDKFDRNYCTEAEELRERLTGIKDRSAPGGMNF